MMLNDTATEYLLRYPALTERQTLLNMLTVLKNRPVVTLSDQDYQQLEYHHKLDYNTLPPKGIFYLQRHDSDKPYAYGFYRSEDSTIRVLNRYDPVKLTPPFDPYDTFQLPVGAINYHGNTPIYTTVAIYIFNYLLLYDVFGKDPFDYVNRLTKPEKLSNQIATAAINGQVTVAKVREYIDAFYFMDMFGDIVVPTFTPKSLTTAPEIKLERDRLYEQHQHELDNPMVVVGIEDKLIEMDKQYLKGDPSKRFYDAIGEKSYAVIRKKMHLTTGVIPAFNATTGTFDYIKNSLSDGWDVTVFDRYCNELRKGAYERAMETMKGGASSKLMGRELQDTSIVIDNCGSQEYLTIFLSEENMSEYLYRHIFVNGKLILLTPEIIKDHLGHVAMRSAQYCIAPNGFCYTCEKATYRNQNLKSMTMQGIQLTSTFTMQAMKNMHGLKIKVKQLNLRNHVIFPRSRHNHYTLIDE